MALTNAKRFKSVNKYYGQLVLGPPGAGKTTYCWKMSELLKKLGRTVVIINLDPANDSMSYKPDIDIRELVALDEVMDQCNLGPNGALLYCMEYLEKNIDWLLNQVQGDNYTNFIFDLPGQVELYCHHQSLSNIFSKLANHGNIQLAVVHLVDSHHCSDAGKFIAALMLSLNAMLKIGLPHVNLLTKVDLLKKHIDKLQFGIDFYTDVLDLNYLLDCLDEDNFTSKYKKLNSAFVSIIEDFSLVTFQLVNLQKEESLINVAAIQSMSKSSKEIYNKLTEVEMNIDQMINDKKHTQVHLLHRYNDIKDATQVVITHIANLKGTTVTEVHKQLNLRE